MKETATTRNSYQSIRITQPDDDDNDNNDARQEDPLEQPPAVPKRYGVMTLAVSLVAVMAFVASTVLSNNKSVALPPNALLLQSPHHTTTTTIKPPQHLSSRAVIPPVRDDMFVFLQAKTDEYHPQTNPQGKLILLVAENRLLYTELSHQMHSILFLQKNNSIPEWVFDYNDMRGQVDFQKAMARMMESSWMAPVPVRPDSLVFASGAGAILDALSWTLAEANQGVLIIPTFPESNYEPTRYDLDSAYKASKSAGHAPRILLICQPHNPTGAVYTHKAMHEMIMWALDHDMHVVSDEIYGNSVFPGIHVTSAAEIMWEQRGNNDTHYLGDQVHIVAGLSKDWGASGVRVGTLMTHNTALYETMGTLSYYNGVSQLTQWAFTQLLDDEDWRTVFLATKEALALINVPVFEGTKGTLFAWADFSAYLRHNQSERELWMELYEQANMLFTLGESFHGEKPGMFRIVYTWPHGGVEAMNEMGRRLVEWKNTRTK